MLCLYETEAEEGDARQKKKWEWGRDEVGRPGHAGTPDTAAPQWEYIGVITPGWQYTRVCVRVSERDDDYSDVIKCINNILFITPAIENMQFAYLDLCLFSFLWKQHQKLISDIN